MRSVTHLGFGAVVAAVLLGVVATPASAAPTFAPADEATIHPGVMTFTEGAGQCTANFVFTSGDDVFLGQAAHCAGTGGATASNGCEAGSLPLGTEVEVEGASQPGVLVYSSWLTMQANGESDENACNFNDFALVQLDPADVDSVNPSLPFWGGPTGLDTDGTVGGERVYSYGDSGLRLGQEALSPKTGTSLGTSGGGWTHNVVTVTPGVPGDSGSAFLSQDGEALGVLVTLQIAPVAGSNGVTDMDLALDYANQFGDLGAVNLELGTEPFDGGRLLL